MDVKLPDGTIVRNVPEGTTQAELMARVGKMRAPAAPTPIEKPGVLEAGARGLLTGGPMNAILSAGGVGVEHLNDMLHKAAYSSGGAATDLATKFGASPETAGGIGAATNAAISMAPMALGGAGIGRTAAPLVERAGERLMQSAIKPAKPDLLNGKADRAIGTFFQEGQNATRGGVENMQQTVTELNRQVEHLIANSPASVRTDVAAQLRGVIDRFHNRPNVVEANQEIANVAQQFANHPLVGGRADIPVQVAHDLKRGYQTSVGERGYGELRTPTVEAEKAVARGMREGVSGAVPEVAPLNARESDLLNAMGVARRGRVLTEGNTNLASLAPLAHSPSAAMLFLIDKYGLTKSLLARLLHSGSETIPTAVGAAAGASLADLQR